MEGEVKVINSIYLKGTETRTTFECHPLFYCAIAIFRMRSTATALLQTTLQLVQLLPRTAHFTMCSIATALLLTSQFVLLLQ